jgi:hypothetical protein
VPGIFKDRKRKVIEKDNIEIYTDKKRGRFSALFL